MKLAEKQSHIIMIWIFIFVSLGLAAAKTYVEPEYLQELRNAGKDEEFAELMGIDVKLVRPSDERSEGSIFKHASPLGDILLTKEQEEQARQSLNYNKWPGNKWPNNRMPYEISDDFNSREKAFIEEAITDWNNKVRNIQLINIRRFRRRPNDYVFVFNGDGCYSYVSKIGGQQALSLQKNGCLWKGTIQHEFMHAAGFTHEHNRPDRDNYIQILDENIPDEWKDQYKRVEEDDWINVNYYDYYSVMHYPVGVPGSNKPAFKVLQSGIDESRIGNGDELTQKDIDKLNKVYS